MYAASPLRSLSHCVAVSSFFSLVSFSPGTRTRRTGGAPAIYPGSNPILARFIFLLTASNSAKMLFFRLLMVPSLEARANRSGVHEEVARFAGADRVVRGVTARARKQGAFSDIVCELVRRSSFLCFSCCKFTPLIRQKQKRKKKTICL